MKRMNDCLLRGGRACINTVFAIHKLGELPPGYVPCTVILVLQQIQNLQAKALSITLRYAVKLTAVAWSSKCRETDFRSMGGQIKLC